MSTEQNKVTAGRWFFDIIAHGHLAVADEIFAGNHIIHDPHAPPGGWPNGPEGLKMVASVFGGALTIAVILLRQVPLPAMLARQGWIVRLHDARSGIPYGVALAAGAFFLLPSTEIFRVAAAI